MSDRHKGHTIEADGTIKVGVSDSDAKMLVPEKMMKQAGEMLAAYIHERGADELTVDLMNFKINGKKAGNFRINVTEI